MGWQKFICVLQDVIENSDILAKPNPTHGVNVVYDSSYCSHQKPNKSEASSNPVVKTLCFNRDWVPGWDWDQKHGLGQ